MSENGAQRFIRPGRNCGEVARAGKLAMIVDAADYFRHLRSAILQAKRDVVLIGWDFDTRINLDPDAPRDKAPKRLGRFLNWVIERRPDLNIRILKWDLGTLKALGRGTTPLFVLDWMTSDRIRFKLDGAHPTGSAHHQKIAVIDDVIAFCGGIDMTADRWDTRDHKDDDPRRRRPTTRRKYGPWHDVTTCVTGEAAAALGRVARDRWKRATGDDLAPPPPCPPIWPEGLTASLEDVDVAVSRTTPDYKDEPGTYEIEALYLDTIRSAKRHIYIESQYFASRRIAEAIVARLAEPAGPEIVVINPKTADGWLEEEIMGSSRAVLLDIVRKADRYGRFRLYYPVTQGGTPIYVHAKVLVADGRFLRVGSSNLNNRSMGFDTECDISVEAPNEAVARRIAALRDDLLAEHLNVTPARVAREIEAQEGSLIAAIENLRGDGRSLRVLETADLDRLRESVLAENGFLDPERAEQMSLRGLIEAFWPSNKKAGRPRPAPQAFKAQVSPLPSPRARSAP